MGQFDNIRIVMVETSHPGNIGAAARAMKNMGLSRLHLVRPVVFPSPEAFARASGAHQILDKALVCDTLEQALTGCHLVFGASARPRTLAWPQVDVRECAAKVVGASANGEVAIVFGREASGLSNDELQLCNYLAHIPCDPNFSSLNVAAAIQVFTYELRMAAAAPTLSFDDKAGEPAAVEDIERFYEHLEQVLVQIRFLDPNNPRQMMRRLRRLYSRVGLERVELNILRGILTETNNRLRECCDKYVD